MAVEKKSDVLKAKEILSKVDPSLAIKALMRYEAEAEKREVDNIYAQIKAFDKDVIVAATAELAPGMTMGYCSEGPSPRRCGGCIVRMTFGGYEEVINVMRGARAARRMNIESGEI